eukprot:augustus_masked-scaffold_54-processed-gene-0.32-mRNA-1 protein AED:0.47 eAED:0.47 QI:0/-1/0/1/-1/1/1/0/790
MNKLNTQLWLPDELFSRCVNCNKEFNLLNRKHHCRICGRIFCASCFGWVVNASQGNIKSCKICYEIYKEILEKQQLAKINRKSKKPVFILFSNPRVDFLLAEQTEILKGFVRNELAKIETKYFFSAPGNGQKSRNLWRTLNRVMSGNNIDEENGIEFDGEEEKFGFWERRVFSICVQILKLYRSSLRAHRKPEGNDMELFESRTLTSFVKILCPTDVKSIGSISVCKLIKGVGFRVNSNYLFETSRSKAKVICMDRLCDMDGTFERHHLEFVRVFADTLVQENVNAVICRQHCTQEITKIFECEKISLVQDISEAGFTSIVQTLDCCVVQSIEHFLLVKFTGIRNSRDLPVICGDVDFYGKFGRTIKDESSLFHVYAFFDKIERPQKVTVWLNSSNAELNKDISKVFARCLGFMTDLRAKVSLLADFYHVRSVDVSDVLLRKFLQRETPSQFFYKALNRPLNHSQNFLTSLSLDVLPKFKRRLGHFLRNLDEALDVGKPVSIFSGRRKVTLTLNSGNFFESKYNLAGQAIVQQVEKQAVLSTIGSVQFFPESATDFETSNANFVYGFWLCNICKLMDQVFLGLNLALMPFDMFLFVVFLQAESHGAFRVSCHHKNPDFVFIQDGSFLMVNQSHLRKFSLIPSTGDSVPASETERDELIKASSLLREEMLLLKSNAVDLTVKSRLDSEMHVVETARNKLLSCSKYLDILSVREDLQNLYLDFKQLYSELPVLLEVEDASNDEVKRSRTVGFENMAKILFSSSYCCFIILRTDSNRRLGRKLLISVHTLYIL